MSQPTNTNADQRPLLFIGNRWVNSIYNRYGIIKQRILLEIIKSLQGEIKKVMAGKNVSSIVPDNQVICLQLDMSQISGYNNYYQVRKAVDQMCRQKISIYNDPEFKRPIYTEAPLLAGWQKTSDRKILQLAFTKQMIELLIHVNYDYTKKNRTEKKAHQFTTFDPCSVYNPVQKVGSSSKYMLPIYLMMASYAERGGFEIAVGDFRQRAGIEEKYKGFDDLNQKILKHVQKELQMWGNYRFNFTVRKKGREVTHIVFKIWSSNRYDYNSPWNKLYRALNSELPYFARFTELQREKFDYLFNDSNKFDLLQVVDRLQYIHKKLQEHKAARDPIKDVLAYTLKSIHERFPPPG